MRTFTLLSLLVLLSCSGTGGDKQDGGSSSAKPKCTNEIGAQATVAGSGASATVKITFDATAFISSWDWFKVPDKALGETCHQFEEADRRKHVVLQSANYLAGKIPLGYVTYDTLPVPDASAGYCWKSSTAVVACYQQGSSDSYTADPGPALGSGTYEALLFKPGFPSAEETGRVRFVIP